VKRIAPFLAAVAALALIVTSCADDLISPNQPDGGGPSLAISDATRGGNAHFFWLPPMAPHPTTSGAFDGTLEPVVQICVLDGDACASGTPLVARFTTEAGNSSETVRVADDHYIVNWHTGAFALDLTKAYRVTVIAAGVRLGFADVLLGANGKGLKTVNSDDFVPLKDGSTLPIKFRIEAGAVVVPTARFAVGGSLQARSATTFDAAASDDPLGAGLTYAWDFGDGGRGGGAQVAHVYTAAGDYAVMLVVTTAEGVQDATTEVVSITPPPAPVGQADLLGQVRETSGAPLAGVSVRVVDGTPSGTTDGDGKVTLADVGTGISVLLQLTRSGYVEQFLEVEIPGDATEGFFEAVMQPRAAPAAVAAVEAGAAVTGDDGVTLELPPDALVDGDGNPVSGTVEITLTPVDVSQPDAGGFPGGFSAVQSDGTPADLMSFGVAEFVVTQGGDELDLALGKTATIEIPIYTGGAALGDVLPLWSLDEATGLWVEEGSGVVVQSTASASGLALRAVVSHFSWWNIDVTMDPFMPLVRCVFGGTPTGCSVQGNVLNPTTPTWTAHDFLPPEGKTLNSPPNVDVLIEAVGTDGTVFGSTIINGAPGATPEVVIDLGDPFNATIACVDGVGNPSECVVRGTIAGLGQVVYENVPLGGRTLPVVPDQDLHINAFGPLGNAGAIDVNGPAGGAGSFVIVLSEQFTPTVRCLDRTGNPTFCTVKWTLPGFGEFQQFVSTTGTTVNLPPDLSLRLTGVDLFGQWSGSTVVLGTAGTSPDVTITLNDPSSITCGGTPDAFPVVTVSLSTFCSAPGIVASAVEAMILVQPGGVVQFASGAGSHVVRDLTVNKPVLFRSADAGTPDIDATGATRAFFVRSIASGTVEFRGLSFRGGSFSTIDASGNYDQVVVDNSTFIVGSTSAIFSGNSTVPGSLVLVRNSTFSFVSGGLLGVFGAGAFARTDVIDNVFSGPSSWGAVQYQSGASGRVNDNTISQRCPVNCIRIDGIDGEVIGNTIVVDPTGPASRGIFALMGAGNTLTTIRDNTISVLGVPGPAPFTQGAIRVLSSSGVVEVTRNIVNAGTELGLALFGTIIATDNVVSGAVTAISGSLSVPGSTIFNNDITGYTFPFAEGSFLAPGTLTCNWWGSAAGPQGDPFGFDPSIFTPWATAPIANGAGGLCNGS